MDDVYTTIQIKRGTSENIESLFLYEGEPAVAIDTGDLYIGTDVGGGVGKKLVGKTPETDNYPKLYTEEEAREKMESGKARPGEIIFIDRGKL